MGTRCLTIFKDEGTEYAVMYRQFDGYPDGHGKELAEFLKGLVLVNGYGSSDEPFLKRGGRIANGMSCLAAQAIARFKGKEHAGSETYGQCGGIYLYPAGTRDCGEDYVYTVYAGSRVEMGQRAKPRLRVQMAQGEMVNGEWKDCPLESCPVLFDGTADEFDLRKIEANQRKAERKAERDHERKHA